MALEEERLIKSLQEDGVPETQQVFSPSPESRFDLTGNVLRLATDAQFSDLSVPELFDNEPELTEDRDIFKQEGSIERQGFVDTFKDMKRADKIAERLPVFGSIFKAAKLSLLLDAIETLNEGTKKVVTVIGAAPFKTTASKKDTERAMKFIEQWVADLEVAQNRTGGGKFANALLEMPAFIVEFMLTGPLFKSGSVATKTTLTKFLGSYADNAVGKLAVRAASAGYGSLLRTAVNIPRVLEGTLSRLTEGLEITEDGAAVFSDAERNPWRALAGSFTDLYIENLSEIAGGAIGEGFAFAGKGIGKKFPMIARFTKELGEAWVKNAPPGVTRTLKEFATKTTSRVGFNGVLGEFAEERLGDIMRAATGLQEWEDVLVSQEELLIEAGIFTVFGTGSLAVDKIFRTDKPAAEPTRDVADIEPKQLEDIARSIVVDESLMELSEESVIIKNAQDAIADARKDIPAIRDGKKVADVESIQAELDSRNKVIEANVKIIQEAKRKKIEQAQEDLARTAEQLKAISETKELAEEISKAQSAIDKAKQSRAAIREGKAVIDIDSLLSEEVANDEQILEATEIIQRAEKALEDLRSTVQPDSIVQLDKANESLRSSVALLSEALKNKLVPDEPKPEVAEEESIAKIITVSTKSKAIEGNAKEPPVVEPAGPVKRAIMRNIARAEDAVGTWGKVGLKVQKDLREISFRTAVNVGNTTQNIKPWTKGLTKSEKVTVAQLVDGAISKEGQPHRLIERAEQIKSELDKIQQEALDLGLRRGELTGKAFPQVLNKEGQAFLEEAELDGGKSPSVYAWAQNQVTEGNFEDVNDAILSLQLYREGLISGKTGYIEGQRTLEIGNDFRDWNLDKILSNTIESSWEKIEAARQWGVLKDLQTDAGQVLLPFKQIQIDIAEIRKTVGKNEANALNEYLKAQYGLSGADTAIVKVARAARTAQFVGKLAFSPLTISRNILDRYAKGLSHGTLFTNARATIKYPPFLNNWMRSARNIEEQMIRSGAVLGHGHLSEGFGGTEGAFSLVARPFASSERGNQTYIALVKKMQLESDIQRLMEIDGPQGPVSKAFDRMATLVGKSQNQTRNRVLTSLTNEQLAETYAKGKVDDLTMAEVLHRTTTDSAFPLTLASKRLWWGNRPVIQAATQFKIWSADQTRFIYKDVLQYGIQTGDYSRLARFMLGTWLMGEMYNISRDFLLNEDEALLSKAKGGTRQEIVMSVGKDLLDGGVIGTLADFTYGLGDWAAGPTLNSITNLTLAIDQARGTATFPEALGQFALRDIPALRQAQGVIDNLDSIFEENNLTENYARWQNRSFDFRRKEGESTGDIIGNRFMRSLRGTPQKRVSERSLSLNMIARQVLVGDYDDAAQHIKRVIRDADVEEIDSAIQSFTQSMRNNSPFGNIAQDKLGLFITKFSPEESVKGIKLQEQWNTGYQKSLAIAFRELEAEGFMEDVKVKAEAYKEKMKPIIEEAQRKMKEIRKLL